MKIILLLLLISFNVNATSDDELQKKAPVADRKERLEMLCFSASQALYKVVQGLRAGHDPVFIEAKIKQNSVKLIIEIKTNDAIINKQAEIAHVKGITNQALRVLEIGIKAYKTIDPETAQKVYYDNCAGAINTYFKNNPKQDKK